MGRTLFHGCGAVRRTSGISASSSSASGAAVSGAAAGVSAAAISAMCKRGEAGFCEIC